MPTAPSSLASAQLIRCLVPAGTLWHHIFLDRHADPLGFGYASSRFSDPRGPQAERFGVYYVAGSFEGAFLETIVRDRKTGQPDLLPLGHDELQSFVHVPITVQTGLDLVDLRGGLGIAMGIQTDAIRASTHWPGQHASLGIFQHPARVDGIRYPSRLNGDDNLAIYDRAVAKLSAGPRRRLGECQELAPILGAYRIALV